MHGKTLAHASPHQLTLGFPSSFGPSFSAETNSLAPIESPPSPCRASMRARKGCLSVLYLDVAGFTCTVPYRTLLYNPLVPWRFLD